MSIMVDKGLVWSHAQGVVLFYFFGVTPSFVLVSLPFQQSSQQPGDLPRFPRPASGRPHSPPQPGKQGVVTCEDLSEHIFTILTGLAIATHNNSLHY